MLTATGLPPNVVATIQKARAHSTRSRYDTAWRVFEQWCSQRPAQVVPYQASVVDVLTFLQEFLDRGLGLSSVKTHLAAISACHVGIDNQTMWKHPLVKQFMKGVRREHRVNRSLVPSWDLSLVLKALTTEPFEPLQAVNLKCLTLKVALLVALTTAKRVSDLHALSTSPECMRFDDRSTKVTIKANPAFIPKNALSVCVPVDLQAFHPPPFTSDEDRRLNCLCPVRALRIYVDRTAPFRIGNQLFVSWGTKTKGKPVTTVTISNWIVEAIRQAYTSQGVEPPQALRAHSTRGMAASWALYKGVSIQEVCTAASWSTPSTFATYYNLDVAAPSLAHAVLGAAAP